MELGLHFKGLRESKGLSQDDLIKGDLRDMKKTIEQDYKRMLFFEWAGLAFTVIGLIAVVTGTTYLDWGLAPSAIDAIVGWQTYALGIFG